MAFFTYSCSSYNKKARSSLLILVPTTKKHGILCLFLFQFLPKSMVYFAYSCSNYNRKASLFCIFLFQLQQKACFSSLFLVSATAKSMIYFAYSCSNNIRKASLFCLFLFKLQQNIMCWIPIRHFFSQSRQLLTKIFKSAETVKEKFRCL
jgi:hypothetical protein